MSIASNAKPRLHPSRPRRRSQLVLTSFAAVVATVAIASIGYLLWPTYHAAPADDPSRLPVSVGGTLFNVPTQAVRVKVQRHSGPQERVDLSFGYPSLDPSQPARRVTAEEAEAALPPIDRIFVSISAHHDVLSPEQRARTIYPRYVARNAAAQDDLLIRSFEDGSAYAGEDLAVAASPPLLARCTRDGVTPGTCLSERRVGGADLTFRFPRAWLGEWRDVAGTMDVLTTQMTRVAQR